MKPKCPYCESEQEINHDDGYGYEEGVFHEQICSKCDMTFAFETTINTSYETYKAPCLNGGKHKLVPVKHGPRYWPDWKTCENCDYENKGKIVENWREL